MLTTISWHFESHYTKHTIHKNWISDV